MTTPATEPTYGAEGWPVPMRQSDLNGHSMKGQPMALNISLHQLERGAVSLQGELDTAALDLDPRDDLVQFSQPLRYQLSVERLGESLIARGRLELPLQCTCIRCLRRFDTAMTLDGWACHIPLEGEDEAAVTHDVVDLTPYLREDILLALPQHPLCESGCCGLPSTPHTETSRTGAWPEDHDPSVWAELDKLKL